MKKNLRIGIIVLIAFYQTTKLSAQNLIPNSGFETFSALPTSYGEFSLATGWENCNGTGTPDYFNTAGTVGPYFGTNLPHTGDAMAGFCPYHGGLLGFREYLSIMLSSPMIVGQTYNVSFWLSNGINGAYGYGCNNIGVAFSLGSLTQTGSLPILISPQLEITTIFYDSNWTQLSFQYTATAAFDYFTIGNFRDDAGTTSAQYGAAYNAVYYFIDDIGVELSNQLPVALFNATNHICPGTCTGFSNTSINATSYLWEFPGAAPAMSTDINPANICYNSPGNYSVTLIAGNANGLDTLTLVNFMNVYPYPSPQGIQQNGDTLFANQGSSGYQWYWNANIINGATNYFYVAPQSGDYNVVCTDANGCEVEAVIFNVIAAIHSPLHENDEKENIILFPNPATDHLTTNLNPETGTIKITNILGKNISQSLYQIEKQNHQTTLDISVIANGIYWLEFSDGKNIYRKQFIKN